MLCVVVSFRKGKKKGSIYSYSNRSERLVLAGNTKAFEESVPKQLPVSDIIRVFFEAVVSLSKVTSVPCSPAYLLNLLFKDNQI